MVLLPALTAWFLVSVIPLTGGQTTLFSLPLAVGSTNRVPASAISAPVLYLGGKPEDAQPLKPGVYQTRPYGIILIVPKRGLDDSCIVRGMSGGSKMPIINPNVQAVPKGTAAK